MPIMLRSSEDNPDTIPAFAESPSQNIIVHSDDLIVPAQLASINFGIPLIIRVFDPSLFLATLFSFTSVNAQALSITPIFANFSTNFSLTVHDEPNLAIGVFI
uniref:Uncharacterized protein n=1 Tax=viral metagenome TaxID=1070528 RepID=A0A6C0AWU5_9ZZZZ